MASSRTRYSRWLSYWASAAPPGPKTTDPICARSWSRPATGPRCWPAGSRSSLSWPSLEGFVATRVIDVSLGERSISATVGGVLGEPPPLVKAVTYHRLSFERHGERYVARVVLDV